MATTIQPPPAPVGAPQALPPLLHDVNIPTADLSMEYTGAGPLPATPTPSNELPASGGMSAPMSDATPAPAMPIIAPQEDILPIKDADLASMPPPLPADLDPTFAASNLAASVQTDLESYAAEEAAVPDRQPVEAFAKLQFPDGDFFVATNEIILGRDPEALKRERRLKRLEKKKKAVYAEEDEKSVADLAQHTLQDYAPSASNISEAGGFIGMPLFHEGEENGKHLRRRRKRALTSNGSSHSQSQSIAPVDLFAGPPDLFVDSLAPEEGRTLSSIYRDAPIIPIHPPVNIPCCNISREHALIRFNPDKNYWELHVMGRNGAWVDGGDLLPKGSVVRLRHGSRIQISAVHMVWKLPDNVREEEEENVVESADSDSDLSNLNSSPEGIEADQDDSSETSDLEEIGQTNRPKVKLTFSKRAQSGDDAAKKSAKLSLKASKERTKKAKKEGEPDPTDVRPSIEDATNGVKPKPEPATVPATPAADLPPGSILAGLAPEEIPQKRKGPGRPPKNGVMSKRDEAIIKRKKKELQKLGREIPPLAELLAMARAEAGSSTKKSEEAGDGEAATTTGNNEENKPATDSTPKAQTAAEIEAAKARKLAKSPSPQKPESEYTEEEMKKPSKTYVVLIHDALSASSTGVMDLQQIYDAIQKMYPYYKYRSTTQGWQSSIRHNLIGSEAFEEAGKIGKGRLWKINTNYPIDKEKKRRAPTPPLDKPQYPYYNNQQYGGNPPPNNTNAPYTPYRPSPYGTPYGPPTTLPNGARPPSTYGQPQQPRGAYSSPYAANPNGPQYPSPYGPPGRPPYQHGTNAPATGPNGTARQSPASATGPTANRPSPNASGQAPARPANAPGASGQAAAPVSSDDTIEEIMSYHKKYLGQFKQGAEQDAARDLFRKAVSRHIDHNKVHGPYSTPEEEKVADVIGEIIKRNKAKQKAAIPPQQGTPRPAGAAPSPGPAGATARPAPGPPQHQAQARPVTGPPNAPSRSTAQAPIDLTGGTSGAPAKPPAPGQQMQPRPGAPTSVAQRPQVQQNAHPPPHPQQRPAGIAAPIPRPQAQQQGAPSASPSAVQPQQANANTRPIPPPQAARPSGPAPPVAGTNQSSASPASGAPTNRVAGRAVPGTSSAPAAPAPAGPTAPAAQRAAAAPAATAATVASPRPPAPSASGAPPSSTVPVAPAAAPAPSAPAGTKRPAEEAAAPDAKRVKE